MHSMMSFPEVCIFCVLLNEHTQHYGIVVPRFVNEKRNVLVVHKHTKSSIVPIRNAINSPNILIKYCVAVGMSIVYI